MPVAKQGDQGLARRQQSLAAPRQAEMHFCRCPEPFQTSRFPVLQQSKIHSIKEIPALEEGDRLPLHHGGDTRAGIHRPIPKLHPGQVY